MRRYNFRPLTNRNMATPVPNIENELDPPHPEHPESNPNMEGENHDAQLNRPSSPGTELLRELRIISHELSSKGSSSKITSFDGSDPEKFRTWQREVTKHCAILGLNEDDKKRILYATAHGVKYCHIFYDNLFNNLFKLGDVLMVFDSLINNV